MVMPRQLMAAKDVNLAGYCEEQRFLVISDPRACPRSAFESVELYQSTVYMMIFAYSSCLAARKANVPLCLYCFQCI